MNTILNFMKNAKCAPSPLLNWIKILHPFGNPKVKSEELPRSHQLPDNTQTKEKMCISRWIEKLTGWSNAKLFSWDRPGVDVSWVASLALGKMLKLFSVTCTPIAFEISVKLPGPPHPGLLITQFSSDLNITRQEVFLTGLYMKA